MQLILKTNFFINYLHRNKTLFKIKRLDIDDLALYEVIYSKYFLCIGSTY